MAAFPSPTTPPVLPLAPRKPVIWAVGISKLHDLYRDVAPAYAARADVQIIDKGYDEVIDALAALPPDSVDCVISAGSNGAYLRARLTVPVVLVKVNGFDVMQALARARRIAPPPARVALVTYGEPVAELGRFADAFGLDLMQACYHDRGDAQAQVRALASQGVAAVAGPGLVTELAEQAGLAGVFLYSHDSVHAAFETALEIARVSRIEAMRRERLDTILRHLRDGVIAVDAQERIQAINPPMMAMLGNAAAQAHGRSLRDVAPALSMQHTLETGETELETIVTMNGKTYVVNRLPILEQGVLTGAVLTCQDSVAFSRVDRSLRSRHRPRHLSARYRLADLAGESAAMRDTRALAARYAGTDSTVLIQGESGTGKELLAQGIHNASRRRDYPFVAINCAAFPEALLESELFGYEEGAFTGARRGGKTGIFETAHNGTLFLDEIGEMPMPLQTRLLRVLQEKEVLRLGANEPVPVDVRVIAATHRDLRERVAQGAFREDLYYRLNILRLALPPLRAREGDIERLAQRLLERALARAGARLPVAHVLPRIAPLLLRHRWPGNVRELENVLERIAVYCADFVDARSIDIDALRVMAPELAESDASFEAATRLDSDAADIALPGAMRELNRQHARATARAMLDACGGDRDEACRRLGISRSTLWRKLRA